MGDVFHFGHLFLSNFNFMEKKFTKGSLKILFYSYMVSIPKKSFKNALHKKINTFTQNHIGIFSLGE